MRRLFSLPEATWPTQSALLARGDHARVQVVGCNDGHHLDAVVARGLGQRHGVVLGVAAPWIQAQGLARAHGFFWLSRQSSGHKFMLTVQPRGHETDRANKRAFAAVDHARPDAGRWLGRLWLSRF